MLQHALQICTIASVTIAVDADLMLAVNVKDFRNIANKFLSKDLADKLTHLVSKASLTRTQGVRLRADKEESGKKKKLNDDEILPNQRSSNVNINKRFLTIKKSNKDSLDCENNLPRPEYVRDELDDILNNNKEYTHNDKPSQEIQSNTPPKTTCECKDQCDTRKKIDYTETKLGEWKYGYDELKKPIDIKNVKNGNLNRYTNYQHDTYYDEGKENQFPSEKNVQYVYETRLVPKVKNKHISDILNDHKHGLIYLGLTHKQKKKEKIYDTQVNKEETVDSYIWGTKQKDSPKPHKKPIEPTELNEMYNKPPLRYVNEFSTTKDDRKIFKEPILGNKYEMHHENKPPKQDERILFHDVKVSKKLKIDKLLHDSDEVKDVREHDTSSRHKEPILGNKYEMYHENIPPKQDERIMFQDDKKSKKFKIDKLLLDSVEVKKVREHNTSSRHKEPILGNKYEMYHKNIPPKQDERILFQDDKKSKKLKIDKLLHDSVEVKEVKGQDTSSRHNLESHIKIQQINPSIHLVGVNHTDRKYDLGTSINNNNDRGSLNKPVEEREDKIRDRKIHNADYENKYEGDEFNNEELLLKHKKRYLDLKGSQASENNREREQSKGLAAHDHYYSGEDKSDTVKPKLKDSLKQSKVVENQSVEGNVKFKKETYRGKKKLRKKPIEENDLYEKTALGSNIERSRETKNKQHNKASQSDSRVELGSKAHKLKLSLQSKEDKGSQESDGKYDLAYKNTRNRKPQKLIEENEIYKKIALGSQNTKIKRITEQSFKDHVRYDQNSNEEPHMKKKPQQLVENDTLEKVELGHEINEYKRNLKQKENRDPLIAKNKLNRYQGYKDDRTGHNSETIIQNDKRDNNTEITKKNKEYNEDITEKYKGYADDWRQYFEEVKSESIKANTESLIDGPVKEDNENTNNFTMKRTSAPKRDFYKLSSPNYYKDLPRVVDKYDFEEPLPERDRERDKEDTLKREHATINRKFKLVL